MKKIFTLAIGSILTMAVMAADHKPSVTVKNSKNYEIVIDGKSYSGSDFSALAGLYPGYHPVKVYAAKRHSFFGEKKQVAGFR